MQASKIVYTHKNLYCYRLRNTSLSHESFTEKMMRDDLDARMERIALVALKDTILVTIWININII